MSCTSHGKTDMRDTSRIGDDLSGGDWTRRARRTPEHVKGDLGGAARGLRRRPRAWRATAATARAGAASKVGLAWNRPGACVIPRGRASLSAPTSWAGRASGPAVTPCPPSSRDSVGLLRRASWPVPPPAFAARRLGARAVTRNRLGAQASLPTKAAPPMKTHFEASLARRLLPLRTARLRAGGSAGVRRFHARKRARVSGSATASRNHLDQRQGVRS